jgi:hypothetical protein
MDGGQRSVQTAAEGEAEEVRVEARWMECVAARALVAGGTVVGVVGREHLPACGCGGFEFLSLSSCEGGPNGETCWARLGWYCTLGTWSPPASSDHNSPQQSTAVYS